MRCPFSNFTLLGSALFLTGYLFVSPTFADQPSTSGKQAAPAKKTSTQSPKNQPSPRTTKYRTLRTLRTVRIVMPKALQKPLELAGSCRAFLGSWYSAAQKKHLFLYALGSYRIQTPKEDGGTVKEVGHWRCHKLKLSLWPYKAGKFLSPRKFNFGRSNTSVFLLAQGRLAYTRSNQNAPPPPAIKFPPTAAPQDPPTSNDNNTQQREVE